MPIEERLEEAARELARVVDHAPVPPMRTRRPRPNRSALVVAAAVVLIATSFVAARSLLHEDGHTSVKTSGADKADITTGRSAETSPPVPLPAGATALSRGPLVGRFGHSSVWTGKELIVWGGWADEHGDRRFDDGAAYDPSTDTWRTIASAPLSPRHEHAAVWSGTEMIIVGGDGKVDGAAYNPARNSWRSLAPAPFAGQVDEFGDVGAAWTGSKLALWRFNSDEVALYDPAKDQWTTTAGPGERFTSGQLLAADADRLYAVGAPNKLSAVKVSYLEPSKNAWTALPALPFRASPVGAAVVGDQLFVWQQGPLAIEGRAEGAVFSPTADTWTSLPPAPLHGCDAPGSAVRLPADSVLVFDVCGSTLILDGSNRSWKEAGLESTAGQDAVSTGTEVLSWGDACCFGAAGNLAVSVTPWRWKPPQ